MGTAFARDSGDPRRECLLRRDERRQVVPGLLLCGGPLRELLRRQRAQVVDIRLGDGLRQAGDGDGDAGEAIKRGRQGTEEPGERDVDTCAVAQHDRGFYSFRHRSTSADKFVETLTVEPRSEQVVNDRVRGPQELVRDDRTKTDVAEAGELLVSVALDREVRIEAFGQRPKMRVANAELREQGPARLVDGLGGTHQKRCVGTQSCLHHVALVLRGSPAAVGASSSAHST